MLYLVGGFKYVASCQPYLRMIVKWVTSIFLRIILVAFRPGWLMKSHQNNNESGVSALIQTMLVSCLLPNGPASLLRTLNIVSSWHFRGYHRLWWLKIVLTFTAYYINGMIALSQSDPGCSHFSYGQSTLGSQVRCQNLKPGNDWHWNHQALKVDWLNRNRLCYGGEHFPHSTADVRFRVAPWQTSRTISSSCTLWVSLKRVTSNQSFLPPFFESLFTNHRQIESPTLKTLRVTFLSPCCAVVVSPLAVDHFDALFMSYWQSVFTIARRT